MDEHNVRRLHDALLLLQQVHDTIDPAYRNEPFSPGKVDIDVMAAQALIDMVLEAEAPGPDPDHITLVWADQINFGCPSQWVAWDAEGAKYCLRFRHGSGTVDRIDPDNSDHRTEVASFNTGDYIDGVIDLPEFAERAGIKLGPGMVSWAQ